MKKRRLRRRVTAVLAGLALAAGAVLAGVPAHAAWVLAYTNSAAKQNIWYGPTASNSVTGTRTVIEGYVPGNNSLVWARTGSNEAIGVGKIVQNSHAALAARSYGKWRFVIDPTDPGTLKLSLSRNHLYGGPMSAPEESHELAAHLLVLARGATPDDLLGAEHEASVSTLVDLTTVRALGELGDARYWTGITGEGDIALIVTLPGGVNAIVVATPEQFLRSGVGVSLSSGTHRLAPVYLIPDGVVASDSDGLRELAANLYAEAGEAVGESGSLTPLSDSFSLVRIPAAGSGR